jgi:hypothetical protein
LQSLRKPDLVYLGGTDRLMFNKEAASRKIERALTEVIKS